MFKKLRNYKSVPAEPSAPTLEEIFSDLETFHVKITPKPLSKQQSSSDNEQWWNEFERSLDYLEQLKTLHNDIEACKIKLTHCNEEIDNNVDGLRKKMEAQLEIIKEAKG